MERIRDTAAVALIAMVSRLLRERPHLADGAAAIEQARSGIGDRAQAALSTALRQRARRRPRGSAAHHGHLGRRGRGGAAP